MNEPIYLTKLSLDAAFCYKSRITDAYSLHRVVYSMLPRTDEPKRILYVDRGSVNGIREVLILSGIMPDIPQNVTASIRKISEKFFTAQKYRFEILLNPPNERNEKCGLLLHLGWPPRHWQLSL